MYKYLFGPVPSRRLGISLGVDLLPFKTCSLNCIYCECKATTNLTLKRREWVPLQDVLSELEHYFVHNNLPDYVTLAGSGEPLLHTGTGKILSFLRDGLKGAEEVKSAVLTNGTLLFLPEVRSELVCADLVIPSLDAATTVSFKRINRPHPALDIHRIIEGLKNFCADFEGTVWLEVFIVPGINDTEKDLLALRDAIVYISPDLVQLNTLDRPGAVANIRPATREHLEYIVDFWNLPNVEIIARANTRKVKEAYLQDVESAILATITRRPCTLEDLVQILGLHPNEINKYLDVLESEKKIRVVQQQRGFFYEVRE